MNLIYTLFRLDHHKREDVVSATSILGIFTNLAVAMVKIIVGILASSIAIASEGVNNASDAFSSVITLLGTKLANKKPDAKHPFGYGRVEYFSSMIISIVIIISGVEMFIRSIQYLINNEKLSVSYISLGIIIFSAVIKFLLGTYTIKKGKEVDSETLQALGTDSRNDSFVSAVTIISAAAFILFKLNIDGYAGIFTSLMIIKAGLEILFNTISELLGQSGNHQLAVKIYQEIRNTKGIINAVDMMLHNYGPDTYTGSVNVEIDHKKTVGEMYDFVHALQLKIMHKYDVVMVFGIYAVDNDSPASKKLRKQIADYISKHEHIRSYHAVYLDKESDKIYCDLVVDHQLQDRDALEKDFVTYLNEKYPKNQIVLNIETEFV